MLCTSIAAKQYRTIVMNCLIWWSPSQVLAPPTVYVRACVGGCETALSGIYISGRSLGNKVLFYQLSSLTDITGHSKLLRRANHDWRIHHSTDD